MLYYSEKELNLECWRANGNLKHCTFCIMGQRLNITEQMEVEVFNSYHTCKKYKYKCA